MAETDKRKEFSNWVCNVLSLNVTKIALHSFVIDKWVEEMKGWNIKSLDDLLEFLTDVENGIIRKGKKGKLECQIRHENCQTILDHLMNLRQNKSFSISVRTILGRKIVRNEGMESDAAAVFREVSCFTPVTPRPDKPKPPDEDNPIFPDCRVSHIWCIANMFMKSESFTNDICNTCPADTDAAMFFRMMKNCKLFDLKDDEDLYQEIIEIRNKLHHSEVNRVKTQDSEAYLKIMKNLLEQIPSLRKDCGDAIKEIEEMTGRRFFLRETKKALFLKTLALETDKKIARNMGQRSDEIEYLQMETLGQFKHKRFTHFLTLKSSEEFKREKRRFREMYGHLLKEQTCTDIKDLEEDLKEQIMEFSETVDVKESDKEEKERLLSSAKNIKVELQHLREKRSEIPNDIKENFQRGDCLELSKELSDLPHQMHKNSQEDSTNSEETSKCISDPPAPGTDTEIIEILDIDHLYFEDPEAGQSEATTQHSIGFINLSVRSYSFIAKIENIEKFNCSQLSKFGIEGFDRFDHDSFEQLKSKYNEMINAIDSDGSIDALECKARENSNGASTRLLKSKSDDDIFWVFPFPAGVGESEKERFIMAVEKAGIDQTGFVLASDTLMVLKYCMSVPTSLLNIDGNVSESQKKKPFEKGTKCMVVLWSVWGSILTVSTFDVIDQGTIQELVPSKSQISSSYSKFIEDVKDGVYQQALGLVDTIVVLFYNAINAVEELKSTDKCTGKCIIWPKNDYYEEFFIKGGLLYGESPIFLKK